MTDYLKGLDVPLEIPLGLRTAIESGGCVLFLGAGIGAHLRDSTGKALPDGEQLAHELALAFKIDCGENYDLTRIADAVELHHTRAELEAFLKKRFANVTPDETLQWLISFRWKAIYTTNYDNGIERAYELLAEPQQSPKTISITSELVSQDPRFDVPIYHLHGALFGPDRPHIIITSEDYARFRDRRKMLFEALKLDFASATVLYIGYSNRDPNWHTVLAEIRAEFYPSEMPTSYRITPVVDPLDCEILKAKKRIETVPGSLADFHTAGAMQLKAEKIDKGSLDRIKDKTPNDLLPAFQRAPVAVARLLNSWTYVNGAAFHETPNIQIFLKGDRPNWALVGAKQYFERDIEDEVYDALIDYATSEGTKPKTCVIHGPAGYGTTTLLMALAARLVNEHAGPVFMLKPGRDLIEGDVLFAASLLEMKPFFFVDNAADYAGAIAVAMQRLKESGLPGMLVLGDRTNELRQSIPRIQGQDFEIEPLSEPEANRLLDYLEKHTALGALEPLSRDMRLAAVMKGYLKELLVVMREATEDKSFDAILVDEFWGMKNELARRLYLTVCCFHQHGAYVRDDLLSKLLDTTLIELYRQTADWTEGVVIFEPLGRSEESYSARARHRIIAAVVWERCGQGTNQSQIVQDALDALNLTYRMDRIVFDKFMRSDRLVDGIQSFEGRIRFFETACRKDPDNPYVRQHYSRMLMRAEHADLALGQINEAISMRPDLRVLHHTKGTVLSHLARTVASREIARRRLTQSEEAFRKGLSMHARDDYSYQGLAELFFQWAQRSDTQEDEATEYLAKAEEVIGQGLKKSRNRESLWIESAKIQHFLGDEPAHLAALEKAVKEHPASRVARYMLGRAYRIGGEPQKAIEVLEPLVNEDHDEYRPFIEYGLAMIALNRPYRDAIAVLRLSTLYGLSDARFIATLGGMLFLDGKFSEAQAVFNEAFKHSLSWQEMKTVKFSPHMPGEPTQRLLVSGTVAVVKAGFSLIDSLEYPRLLCPASKSGGLIMEQGLKVDFELAFSAKCPVALNPRRS